MTANPSIQAPYSLTAEITHRCPLNCLYCSNPVDLARREDELAADQWLSIFREAAALGVVQINMSGGEPLVSRDLETLIAEARRLDMYTHLVTSGVGLTQERMSALVGSGLESLQISIQSSDRALAESVAGVDVFQAKSEALKIGAASGLPLTLNVVLHRMNLHQIESIIEFALAHGAARLELANTQFYGWALANRTHLIPSRSQLDLAQSVVDKKRQELQGKIEIIWVLSDYHEQFPKPCMGGWAATSLAVAPDGTALPCLAARAIDTISFPSAITHPLSWVWYESEAFNAFRGYGWMKEPCLSCERKTIDFGGCRCQAFLLTGDAAKTDPVCSLSASRKLIDRAIAGTGECDGRLNYRQSER